MYPVTPELVKATQAQILANAERARLASEANARKRHNATRKQVLLRRPRRRLRPNARGALA